jgi:hypothetical protein
MPVWLSSVLPCFHCCCWPQIFPPSDWFSTPNPPASWRSNFPPCRRRPSWRASNVIPAGLPFYLGRTATLITVDGREFTSNYILFRLKKRSAVAGKCGGFDKFGSLDCPTKPSGLFDCQRPQPATGGGGGRDSQNRNSYPDAVLLRRLFAGSINFHVRYLRHCKHRGRTPAGIRPAPR